MFLRALRKEGGVYGLLHPGLILLDLRMSKKDGFQALKEVKGNEKLMTLPMRACRSASTISLRQFARFGSWLGFSWIPTEIK
jgi:CheY-like chemotaxis protein